MPLILRFPEKSKAIFGVRGRSCVSQQLTPLANIGEAALKATILGTNPVVVFNYPVGGKGLRLTELRTKLDQESGETVEGGSIFWHRPLSNHKNPTPNRGRDESHICPVFIHCIDSVLPRGPTALL
jgi:hypothetical protein